MVKIPSNQIITSDGTTQLVQAITKSMQVTATVYNDQVNTYSSGMKQTFASDATNAGMAFGGVSADPSSLVANDFWFRSDLGYLSYYDVNTVRRIPALGKANTW